MKLLQGARVLVTRPQHQADNLCQLVEAEGGIAVRLPTIAIVPHPNQAAIHDKLVQLADSQWLVFISANAVNFAVKAFGGKIAKLPCIVAVGPATANALQAAGWPVGLMADAPYSTEALLALPNWQQVAGQSFLIVRGEGGREDLANGLRARGAKVSYIEVYQRILPQTDCSAVLGLLAAQQLDVITATSVEALQNLLAILQDNAVQQLLFKIPLVVISERIRNMAVKMGFERVAVTESPSDAALLQTITTCVAGGQHD
jgi:uroporphyrinogen-III synthase